MNGGNSGDSPLGSHPRRDARQGQGGTLGAGSKPAERSMRELLTQLGSAALFGAASPPFRIYCRPDLFVVDITAE